MAEYIEREMLLAHLEERRTFLFKENGDYDHYASGFDEACDRVEDFPVADVAPVVHGKWEIVDHYPYPETIRCSSCGREFGGNTDWLRCPLCETRMDGE